MFIDAPLCASSPPTIGELSALYLTHAHTYYRRRSGAQTREAANIASVLKSFVAFTGADSPATRINKHQVRAWVDQLAASGITRGYCNASLSRLRRCIRWASDLDYLPSSIAADLQGVRPLPAHRSAAAEPDARQPVPVGHVARILPFLPPIARDVLQLLMLTGARPGEILEATNADIHIDQHGARISPAQHKTAHKGKHRVIALSPRALTIVERRWRPLCPSDALFPAPRSTHRLGYSIEALRAAISRACKRAAVANFTPYQVRHRVGRDVRAKLGLDAAQAILGHARSSTTEIYAPMDGAEQHTFKLAKSAAEALQ